MTGTRTRRWRSTRVAVAVALAVVASSVVTANAAAAACTERMPGGEWTSYGQDLMGQQRQDAETVIDPSNVGRLEQIWETPDTGYQSAPPIVSGGCVFINTGGRIVAYDLDTGAVVWESQGADTSGTFAVSVVNGRVHVALGMGRPRAAAFDMRNGRLLWTSGEIWFGEDTNQLASAVVYDGLQVLFTTGPDFDPNARQGYGIIDAATGKVLYKRTTLTKDELGQGYNGGGVWGTPTVDPKTGYLYAGTSNPESKTKEHQYDNAVLKIDLNRKRKTFGQIVGSYKGTPDSYTGYDNPICQNLGDTAWVDLGVYGSSPTCGQLDVDFGNGPTLWRDRSGRTLGAAVQKSGVLHVFDATTMKPVWNKLMFPTMSWAGANLGRAATDGEMLYAVTNPGSVAAFDGDTGQQLWQTPVGRPTTGGNAALANGVVYWVDGGNLNALDAKTGAVLLMRPSTIGGAALFGSIASSVAVAGNTVIANHAGIIAAYRIPSSATSAASAPAVAAGPGAATAGYATRTALTRAGRPAEFVNADITAHDVIAKQRGKNGKPVFRSPLVSAGQISPIAGIDQLDPGVYDFYCSLHTNMTGSLTVQ
jgi:polyvinyl alcohol dehydrogenase (cytochrome)